MSIAELHKLSAVEKLEALWGDLVNDEDNGCNPVIFDQRFSIA
jgi:hypothetical protein